MEAYYAGKLSASNRPHGLECGQVMWACVMQVPTASNMGDHVCPRRCDVMRPRRCLGIHHIGESCTSSYVIRATTLRAISGYHAITNGHPHEMRPGATWGEYGCPRQAYCAPPGLPKKVTHFGSPPHDFWTPTK